MSARRYAFLTLSGVGAFSRESSASSPSSDTSSSAVEAVSDQPHSCVPKVGAGAFDTSQCGSSNESKSSTLVGLGLLHAAAAMGDIEATLALAHRYQVSLLCCFSLPVSLSLLNLFLFCYSTPFLFSVVWVWRNR